MTSSHSEGLPAYAEANEMVLLYPQSAKFNNPASDACWDWYGATTPLFDTKEGVQITFVLEMIRQLRGTAALGTERETEKEMEGEGA